MSILLQLQEWYSSYCDGEWEHQQGIRIGTIDNPGWRVKINLIGSKNENVKFERIEIERNDNNWIHAWVENKVFNVACGSLNLEEALEIFLKWALRGRNIE